MKRLLIVLLWALAVPALAQPYPSKPVRLIVPYPPGGGNDTLGRLFAAKLGERTGQQFVVENRPGAGAMIGTEAAAKSAPDGYTILLSSIATHALSPNLYSRVPYDPVKDFAPITLLGIAPTVLVVNAELPAKNLRELIDLSRKQQLAYASGGNGTPPHINAEVFKALAGVDLLHVAYKGGGPALVDLMAGRVQLMLDTAASAMPHVRSGKLRALALSAPKRSADLPELPTFAEAGLPQYDTNAWYSMHAPAGTPPDIVRRLNAELVAILRDPDIVARFKQLATDPVGNSPEEFAAFVKSELEKYARVIKSAGIKLD
ncbi:MAG TPA: tripartite tricarboxylate transporter substrate binding protein [Burkholderiales bacterium]|jgi:tripartite-type tricarboxylate transporter receptor subunit TctC|nr:tripartite tricarboxylate transporter substrate binding protein [Burkholderiales bacterium]